MGDLNRVELEGVVVREPRVGQGKRTKYAFFTLENHRAEERRGLKIDVAAFGKLADVVEGSVAEGTRLKVIGSLRWRPRDGAGPGKLDVVADRIELIGPTKNDQELPF